MTQDDLGPMPEPEIEPGEPNPGGVDAIDGGEPADQSEPLVPDLDPESNPAMENAPAETKEGEDTSTEATRTGDDVDPTEESPA